MAHLQICCTSRFLGFSRLDLITLQRRLKLEVNLTHPFISKCNVIADVTDVCVCFSGCVL
ncbi:hypothetical protein PR003_g14325 [Phytophthora rubi]|uniref:Uncharacterized protein n=1 Tax=Phytophthora rubi TaxID=129364 RepID=A0A6A4FED9_9STRA|nr:hypothetical protein PR002_g13945 [Phytophthora rubi]KAE9332826.1 hypothetical protein PR003_g14325 [Phytophthora rubi]